MPTDENYPVHWCRKVSAWNIEIEEIYKKGDEIDSYESHHAVNGTLKGSMGRNTKDIDADYSGILTGPATELADNKSTVPLQTESMGELAFRAHLLISGEDDSPDYKLVIAEKVGPDIKSVTRDINTKAEHWTTTSIPWMVAAEMTGVLPTQKQTISGQADEPSSGPDDTARGSLKWSIKPVTSDDDSDDDGPLELARVTKLIGKVAYVVRPDSPKIVVWTGMLIYRGDVLHAEDGTTIEFIDRKGVRGSITDDTRAFGQKRGPGPSAVMGQRG